MTTAIAVSCYLLVVISVARRLAWEWNNDPKKSRYDSDRRLGATALSFFLLPMAVIVLTGRREEHGFDRPPRKVRKKLVEAKKEQSLADTEQRVKQLQREIDALANQ